jgi:transcriptional regulator with XRE-family HTH domain
VKSLEERPLFGQNLFRLRNARHLSQHQLARLIGVDQAVIAVYETRQLDPPVSLVVRLAKVLGVSFDELIVEPKNLPEKPAALDPRILRKALEIASLPQKDRRAVYELIKKLRAATDDTLNVAEHRDTYDVEGDIPQE